MFTCGFRYAPKGDVPEGAVFADTETNTETRLEVLKQAVNDEHDRQCVRKKHSVGIASYDRR
jgi:hypothetical protein